MSQSGLWVSPSGATDVAIKQPVNENAFGDILSGSIFDWRDKGLVYEERIHSPSDSGVLRYSVRLMHYLRFRIIHLAGWSTAYSATPADRTKNPLERDP